MDDGERPSKRTRIDDEGTSCGAPSSSTSTLDNLKRDPDLWLEDGNIVVVARDVAFRIYRGLLTKQSTVFADMFATGDPAADESLDGCPVVRLPDAPSDLKHLLHFLVPSVGRSFLDHKRPIEFPELFAVVHLAHKYNIESLLEQALHVLKQFYTTSFSKYERRPHSHPNFARPRLVHHIGAVNLARLTNTLSILPIALYHCCALSGTVMDGWTRDTGETEHLSMQDLRAVLTARGELAGRGFAMLLNVFEDHPAQDCAQPGLCGIVLTGLIRSVEWIPADGCTVLDSWEVEIRRLARELEICKTCRRAMSKRDVKERRDVWDMLPAIFGLSKVECQWDAPVPGDDGSSDSDSD